MIVGLVWNLMWVVSAFLIPSEATQLVGILLSAISGFVFATWLVVATIYRFNTSGKICSGDYSSLTVSQLETSTVYLYYEGRFLLLLLAILWAFFCIAFSIVCCYGIV